jgi:hypothetical protein
MEQEQFIQNLCDEFPYLSEDILDDDYEGLLTLQIGVFRESTQEAIDNNDSQKIDEHLNFILNNFNKVNDKVQNSIVLSYIGKLNFKKHLKPKLFREFQNALENYNALAYKDEKLINFLKNISKK